jgi:hypothetical protein
MFEFASTFARQRPGWISHSTTTILFLLLLSVFPIDAYTIQRSRNREGTTGSAVATVISTGRQQRSRLLAFAEPSSKSISHNALDPTPQNQNTHRSISRVHNNDVVTTYPSDFFFDNRTGVFDEDMQWPRTIVNGAAVSSSRVNGFAREKTECLSSVPSTDSLDRLKRENQLVNGRMGNGITKPKDIDRNGSLVDESPPVNDGRYSVSTLPQKIVRDGTTNEFIHGTMEEEVRLVDVRPFSATYRQNHSEIEDDNLTVISSKRNIPKTTTVDDAMGSNSSSSFGLSRMFRHFKRLAKKIAGLKPMLVVNSGAPSNNTTDDAAGSFSEDRLTRIRRLWRRRHARTLEEGIRRERTDELSVLMTRAQIDVTQGQDRSYIERTLMGVINVLAEEVEDLDIDLTTVPKTPIWRKGVEELRISFSRLGFRPIRMGGTNAAATLQEASPSPDDGKVKDDSNTELPFVKTADEGFDKIDEDNSGTLDRDELAQALSSISPIETNKESIKELASELLLLYDVNGDGVVDRAEYQQMVEDMAKFRSGETKVEKPQKKHPFAAVVAVKKSIESVSLEISKKAAEVASAARDTLMQDDSSQPVDETEMGSIVLSNLSLDLRRLVLGVLPIVKTLTPGGPLILEPFTATITASFSRDDVMGSFLLDAGLRRLVARALRVRVRSYRDIVDGAFFFGRRWKMFSKTAPVVEVLGLSNVEFDSRDKMVITGRARIRTSPDAPVVTNTFKVRTKIGTRKNGHVIRLVEPELAFVFECPEAIEKGLRTVCEAFEVPAPKRPEPVYSFFPIYSPFKVDDNDGFDMGEDNCIRSIYIRGGKLRFEMSAVLRPGRFLGNHYVAFTLPMRTFIITMDRVWEGVRAARENKKVAARAKKLKQNAEAPSSSLPPLRESTASILSPANRTGLSALTPQSRLLETLKKNKPKPRSFFTRFVEGYTMLESQGEAKNERLTNEISDWFGRQGQDAGSNTSTKIV